MGLFHTFAQKLTTRVQRKGRAVRPLKRPRTMRLEALEDRAVPALFGEFTVKNDTVPVVLADNASALNGMSVAVYTRTVANNNNDIVAKLYNADGASKEITIASGSFNDFDPSVAMDDSGNFVVSWTRVVSGGQLDVVARRFDNQGKPQPEGLLLVGATTANETQSDVAMNSASGQFVVAYTRSSNSGLDVFAKPFKIVNGFAQAQGTVSVSSLSGVGESEPSVAMNSNGFAVAYTSQKDGANPDVKLKRFDNNGGLLGTTNIAVGAGTERNPSLSMDGLGRMVVAYEQFNGNDAQIFARRVSNAGVLGGALFIQGFTNRDLTDPEVALNANGDFVVAYNLFRPDGSHAVGVTEVGRDDVIRPEDQFVIENATGPAVSAGSNQGEYFLTYEKDTAGDQNIFGQRGRL